MWWYWSVRKRRKGVGFWLACGVDEAVQWFTSLHPAVFQLVQFWNGVAAVMKTQLVTMRRTRNPALSRLRAPFQECEMPIGLAFAKLGAHITPRLARNTDPDSLEPLGVLTAVQHAFLFTRAELEAAREQEDNARSRAAATEEAVRLIKSDAEARRAALLQCSGAIHTALDRLVLRITDHELALRQASGVSADGVKNAHRGLSDGAHELHEVMISVDPARALQQALSEAVSLRVELKQSVDHIRAIMSEGWISCPTQQQLTCDSPAITTFSPSPEVEPDPSSRLKADVLLFGVVDSSYEANAHHTPPSDRVAISSGGGGRLYGSPAAATPSTTPEIRHEARTTAALRELESERGVKRQSWNELERMAHTAEQAWHAAEQ
mmetsp:Transcript_10445/g.22034  ORF Transcript_10445/g.22034 Transcript_10445/m.22034 type:complete len:379 (+) Transcript_10445:163-1299(+)